MEKELEYIKPSELRLGNIVHCTQFSDETIVEGISSIGITHKTMNEGITMQSQAVALQPIPLTEEWLLKLGFVNIDTNEDGGDNFYHHNPSDIGLDRNFQPFGIGVDVDLKHVHTLQNLYYSLTGKELKILESIKKKLEE